MFGSFCCFVSGVYFQGYLWVLAAFGLVYEVVRGVLVLGFWVLRVLLSGLLVVLFLGFCPSVLCGFNTLLIIINFADQKKKSLPVKRYYKLTWFVNAHFQKVKERERERHP